MPTTGTIAGSHIYTEDGLYTVVLTVMDDNGGVDIETFTATVLNVAPTADAGGPYSGDEGGSILLSALGSTDPGNDIALYEWDLDDDGLYDDATGSTATSPR